MTLDAKAIDRALRHVLWPACKGHGFADVSGRNAWRRRARCVDVVNVQSSSENVYGSGTALEFYVNLGVRANAIPSVSSGEDIDHPKEYQCNFRWRLPASPVTREANPALWAIEPDGSDFVAVVDRMAQAFEADGLAWFERLATPDAMLGALLGEVEVAGIGAMQADAGAERMRETAYLALAAGRYALAVQYFDKVLASDWKPPALVLTRIRKDRARALAGG